MNAYTKLLSALTAAGIAILALPSSAQNNADAGAQLANNGSGAATACAGCHGAKGEGNAGAGFPRLAGQPPAYLAKQLKSYADGSRANAVMMPIAKALNAQQMDAVAAYYASLDTPSGKPAQSSGAASLQRGKLLAMQGDDKLMVQACANCHGPGGVGMPPVYPYLSGQHASYLIAALGAWKDESRKTDPSQQMTTIAKRLTTQDIAAVAAYYASQTAPKPALTRGNAPAQAGEATQTAGQQSGSPAQGIGSEQGAATSGGSQGPGGGGGASGTGPSGTPKK